VAYFGSILGIVDSSVKGSWRNVAEQPNKIPGFLSKANPKNAVENSRLK
jgi:hypothetical protein